MPAQYGLAPKKNYQVLVIVLLYCSGCCPDSGDATNNDKDDPKFSSQEFKVEVKNVNRPPKLAKIDNQEIKEMVDLKTIDPNDISSLVVPIEQARVRTPGKKGVKKVDEDIDLQDITYSCIFDNEINGSVSKDQKGKDCLTLKGVQFEAKTGVMDWKPDYTQSGLYEFKITAVDNDPIPHMLGRNQ